MASVGALHAARLLLRVAYSPDQPRDEQGQWTSGPGVFFHGTSEERLTAILKEGIKSSVTRAYRESDEGFTYVTSDPVAARHWANATGSKSIAVVRIILPKDVESKLLPDIKPGSKRISFKLKGDILPDWIKEAETVTFGKGIGWTRRRMTGAASRYPLRDAADVLAPKFSIAVRAAFALGRKALPDVDAAVKAVARALAKTVPGLLAKALEDGGQVASGKLRVAKFDPNQPRDEQGQWTATGTFENGRRALARKPSVNRVKLERRFVDRLISLPESGMGYQRVDIRFEGGRELKDVVVFNAEEADVPDEFAHAKITDVQLSRVLAAKKPLVMQFDATAPRVKSWARRHAAELVKGVADVTRDRLRAVVTKHVAGDLDDADYADALADAVGDAERAETIARTESMIAVHRGQREAWSQAIDEGLLSENMKRVWIVTADDRLCPICEPLDGETAALDGRFDGEFEGPPAHPNCRCTEGLQ